MVCNRDVKLEFLQKICRKKLQIFTTESVILNQIFNFFYNYNSADWSTDQNSNHTWIHPLMDPTRLPVYDFENR